MLIRSVKPLVQISILSLLIGCGTQKIADYEEGNTTVNEEITDDQAIDSIITPYKDSMEQEMNAVIGTAEVSLTKGNPESPLGNFSAEAAYLRGFELGKGTRALGPNIMKRSFALLNTGGLRAPINKGEITLGNLYELMPFDNTLVLLKISADKAREMCRYLYECNGQPVFNASFTLTSEGEKMSIGGEPYHFDQDIVVITSDYLASGGDKMDFFKDPLLKLDSGEFLRDVFIDFVKKNKTLGSFENTGKFEIINE